MWHLLARSSLSEWPRKQVKVYLVRSVHKTRGSSQTNHMKSSPSSAGEIDGLLMITRRNKWPHRPNDQESYHLKENALFWSNTLHRTNIWKVGIRKLVIMNHNADSVKAKYLMYIRPLEFKKKMHVFLLTRVWPWIWPCGGYPTHSQLIKNFAGRLCHICKICSPATRHDSDLICTQKNRNSGHRCWFELSTGL